jgi:hypothetical protein
MSYNITLYGNGQGIFGLRCERIFQGLGGDWRKRPLKDIVCICFNLQKTAP